MECRLVLLVWGCIISIGQCYKILGFFPIPGKSQHHIFEAILLGLANKGHQVVYLTPTPPDQKHPNLDVRLLEQYKEEFHATVFANGIDDSVDFIRTHRFYQVVEMLAHKMYGQSEAQKLIHGTESFDAVLMESNIFQEPVSVLIHKFGCVAIEISTLGDVSWLNEMAGLPDNPSYQIGYHSRTYDEMSFIERLKNAYDTWSIVLTGYLNLSRMQGIADKYFNYTGWESRPPLHKLYSNKSMILMNQGHVLKYPYPLAPHVKEVLGVHLRPGKPLPKEMQKFMNEAKNGVIYFSLGSNVKTSEVMGTTIGKKFREVFKNVPQRILMKWEDDVAANLPENVMTSKWIPQQDVLAHKNCKLFITHGGLLSLTETIYHGVPFIGIPFFFDQPKNMLHVKHYDYGIYLSQENITVESAKWAISEGLNNPRYKLEVKKRQSMMKEQRHTGLEEAVYWVEYAIKYPNVLTPRSAFMSAIEVHLIDIHLFILLSIIVTYKSIKYFLQLIVYFLSNKKDKTD